MQDFPLTVTAILRHGTEVHADRAALTAAANGFRTTTYGQLGARAAQLANGLRGLGVAGDQRVATFLWNNQEHLEAYFAVPSMGAVLHCLNIRLSGDQIAYIANQAEDQVILVDLSIAELLEPVLPRLATVHTIVAVGEGDIEPLVASGKTVLRYDELIAGQRAEFEWPSLDEKSAAAMCYTSGTTGHPKGVVYSHRSIYLHATTACSTNGFTIGAEDRVMPIVPMFHANAWGLPHAALMAGADLVLPDRFLDADRLLGMIETGRPTVAAGVPTIWNDILRTLESRPGQNISSLRQVVCGGSAVPLSMMQAYEDQYGIPVLQAWGMTETSPIAAVARPPADAPTEKRWALRSTQGRPVCGVEARIVDDQGRPLARDGQQVGELEVRGPWITGSYYQVDDQSAFCDGWLRTGDVGRIDQQGYLTLTDRAKDVIKSGGEWISSVELENHIMSHPAVFEAAVVGVPDERWQERPLAAVVMKPDCAVTIEELRQFLADRVVRWWLPERWTFVDAIPRTSVGKYDKKELRSIFASGALNVLVAQSQHGNRDTPDVDEVRASNAAATSGVGVISKG